MFIYNDGIYISAKDVIIYSSFFYENAETMGEEAQYQRIGAYSGPHEKG